MKKPVSLRGQAGRRQLLATLGSLAVFSLLFGRLTGKGKVRRIISDKKDALDCGPGPSKTVRMLTEAGTLVEVDPALGRMVKKVSDEELRDWIKPGKL